MTVPIIWDDKETKEKLVWREGKEVNMDYRKMHGYTDMWARKQSTCPQ